MFIIQTKYGYYFRYRIPEDLTHQVGLKEIRRSLRTGRRKQALTMANEIGNKVKRLMSSIRDVLDNGKGHISMNLNAIKIQQLIDAYIKESLQEDEDLRITKGVGNIEAQYDAYRTIQDHYLEALQHGGEKAVKAVGHRVNDILEKEGIHLDPESMEYRTFCREFLKAFIDMLDVEKERTIGIYRKDEPTREPTPEPEPDLPLVTLEQLIAEYKEERVKKGRWSKGTIRNYQPYINGLTQYLGADTNIRTITRPMMVEYKKLLTALPSGFARLKAFKDGLSGLTPDTVPKCEGRPTLDITTIRAYLQFADSVFSFGVRNGYIESNPSDGLKPPKKKRAREQRQAFDEADLQKLFDPEQYSRHSKPYQFWLPILALYTGCRLEELSQLYCEDVQEIDGIWCLDINDSHDKKLKTESSARMVPLHPILTDTLNFPKFVQHQASKGHQRVFPELKKQSGAYGHYASRWFGRFKARAGIDTTTNKKVFHSFRHSFTDTLYKALAPESVIEELTGRAGKTETSRRYAKGLRVPDLFEVLVSKLNYPVDLSHLKASKWVLK